MPKEFEGVIFHPHPDPANDGREMHIYFREGLTFSEETYRMDTHDLIHLSGKLQNILTPPEPPIDDE